MQVVVMFSTSAGVQAISQKSNAELSTRCAGRMQALCKFAVGNESDCLLLLQERAFVTGLRAANLVIDRLGQGLHANILPVEPDEPYIAALKDANRAVKGALRALGLRSPFL